MKKLDLLLVARPDHSMLIYNALRKQSAITYRFVIFKVLPEWMRCFVKRFRVQFVSENAIISYWVTLKNLCQFTFQYKWARNFSEDESLSPIVRKQLKKTDFRIIHYWSPFAVNLIEKYGQKHPNVFLLRDVHMPSWHVVKEIMEPVFIQYGMNNKIGCYDKFIRDEDRLLKNATNILVPSEYVTKTFLKHHPDKNYYEIPYGILKSKDYQPREHVVANHHFKFVYAGGISLEKGCDILFKYFSRHPEYELHLYGALKSEQKHIFDSMQAQNIILHGVVAKSILQQELSKYDIGIHLSRFDAYSLAVGEILGCGLPVIVSETTGNEHDVRIYKWGYVTDNSLTDIDENVKKITLPQNYNNLLDSIHNYLMSGFESYGEAMIDFYKTILTKLDETAPVKRNC